MSNSDMAQEIQTIAFEALEHQKIETLRTIGSQLGIQSDSNRSQLIKQILSMLSRRIFSPDHIISNINELKFNIDTPLLRANPILQIIVHQYNDILGKHSISNPFMNGTNFNSFDLKTQEKNAEIFQNIFQQFSFEKGTSDNCICTINPLIQKIRGSNNNQIKCVNTYCQKVFHSECLNFKEPLKPSDYKSFECPYCILYKMDPLNEVQETMLGPFIVMSNTVHEFQIPVNTYKQIKDDPFSGLEIRCIRIDGNLYENTWPDMGDLHLNSKTVIEFKPLQNNSALKKRKDDKFFTRELNCGQNNLKIKEGRIPHDQKKTYRIHENATYMAAAYVVKKLDFKVHCEKVRQNYFKSFEDSRAFILQNMNEAEEIKIDKVNINLIDSIDLRLISTPVRGRFCNHPQCFSLENYIQMTGNMTPRRWKCPLCGLKCLDLWIDGFVLQILDEIKGSNKNIREIIVLNDGSFELKEDKETKSDIKQEMKPIFEQKNLEKIQKPIQTIVIDLDDEEFGGIQQIRNLPEISDGRPIELPNINHMECEPMNNKLVNSSNISANTLNSKFNASIEQSRNEKINKEYRKENEQSLPKFLPPTPQVPKKPVDNLESEKANKKKSTTSFKVPEKPDLDFGKSNSNKQIDEILNSFSNQMNYLPLQQFLNNPQINFFNHLSLPPAMKNLMPNYPLKHPLSFANNFPSMPNMPNMQNMPNMPNLQNMFNMPGMPNLGSMNNGMGNIPNFSSMPNMGNLGGLPNMSNFQNMNMQGLPNLSNMSMNGFPGMNFMNFQNMPNPMNMPSMSGISGMSGMTGMPNLNLPNMSNMQNMPFLGFNTNQNLVSNKSANPIIPSNKIQNPIVSNPLKEIAPQNFKNSTNGINIQPVNQNIHPNTSLEKSLLNGEPRKKLKKDDFSSMDKFNLNKEFYQTYKGKIRHQTGNLKRLEIDSKEFTYSDFNNPSKPNEILEKSNISKIPKGSKVKISYKVNTFIGKVFKRQFYEDIGQEEKKQNEQIIEQNNLGIENEENQNLITVPFLEKEINFTEIPVQMNSESKIDLNNEPLIDVLNSKLCQVNQGIGQGNCIDSPITLD